MNPGALRLHSDADQLTLQLDRLPIMQGAPLVEDARKIDPALHCSACTQQGGREGGSDRASDVTELYLHLPLTLNSKHTMAFNFGIIPLRPIISYVDRRDIILRANERA
jgi:hypothetical protein